MSCKICINKCFGKGCCDVNYNQLDCILYSAKIYLADLQSKILSNLLWFNRENVPRLVSLSKAVKNCLAILQKEWEAYKLGFHSCLCKKDICALIEKLNSMIPGDCANSCRTDQIIING